MTLQRCTKLVKIHQELTILSSSFRKEGSKKVRKGSPEEWHLNSDLQINLEFVRFRKGREGSPAGRWNMYKGSQVRKELMYVVIERCSK